MSFGEKVTTWYQENKRDLPWRKTKDPYKIWLSEVLLQQTRVDQGIAYYLRFVERFPTVYDLANASEEEVLNLWQGLGYYSRARNLHFAAQQIVKDFEGVFPNTYKKIKLLKGVGDYTAAAIASIGFGESEAVVDGNVYRVLSRNFKLATPIDSTKGKKDFKVLAEELLGEHNPSLFNQGVMELGAMVCAPKKPNCIGCPVNDSCLAFADMSQLEFPVKSKKIKQQTRYFNYIVIREGDKFFIEQRKGKGIWENMYQFPLLETTIEMHNWENEIKGLRLRSVSLPVKHILSHQKIFAKFWEFEIDKDVFVQEDTWLLADREMLSEKPLPRLIENYVYK